MNRLLHAVVGLSLTLSFGLPNVVMAEENALTRGTAELYSSCGGFLEAPVFDDNGSLWLLDVPGDRVLKINAKGECVEKGKTGGAPNGAAFDSAGRLFLAGSQGILIFDQNDASISLVADSYQGELFGAANDMVFTDNDDLYFTVPNDSNLFNPVGQTYYLAANSTEPVLFLDQLIFANGIALSADQSAVLVAEFAAKRVVSKPAVGAQGFGVPMVYVYTEGNIGPDGITVDERGRLYVANLGSSDIQVFENNGVSLGTIKLPEEAGKMASNVVVNNGFLYITEAQKGDVWRVRLSD